MVKESKKIKIKKVKTEEQNQIESFIKIVIGLLLIVAIIYGFTRLFVTKETSKESIDITKGEINYNKLIVGNILNQSYEEYYVFVYHGNDNEAIYYNSIIETYIASKDAKKVYWIDLDNELNRKYIAVNKEEINKKASSISELKFGDYTLLKIKNKKIVKYIDNIEDTKLELNKKEK